MFPNMLACGHKWPRCNLWMVTEPLCSGLKDPKTASWQPCKVRFVTGGKWGHWNEYVDINTIWFFGFKLTPSGILPQYVKDRIDEYDL